VYPILFEPFGFPISTFGVMLALGFLAGTALVARRFRELDLDPDLATTMMIYCMVGGIGGAKLYFAIDVSFREPGASFWSLLVQREGITFYGGLIGGTLAGYLGTRIHGIPTLIFANASCMACAVGQAIGRIGCFLVGDDYGRPTDLPWGVAFPEGAPPVFEPVHPTQLYETAWLLPVTALLWRRRNRSPFLFGEFVALNGLGRFFIEFLRLNPKVAWGLTEAQWIAMTLVFAGCASWVYFQRRAPTAATV